MADPIGYQKAHAIAASLIGTSSIQGMTKSAGQLMEDAKRCLPGFTVTWERTWAVGASIMVRFEKTGAQSKGHEILRPEIEISWSSTRHSVVTALAALTLHREVTELAALVQAVLDREQILDRDEPQEA
jgi:hypothetical protein